MAHNFLCPCKRCNPTVMDMVMGSSQKSKQPKQSKKPNFTSRSNKSPQSQQQSADRAQQQRDRRDSASPHNDGIKSNRRPGGGR